MCFTCPLSRRQLACSADFTRPAPPAQHCSRRPRSQPPHPAPAHHKPASLPPVVASRAARRWHTGRTTMAMADTRAMLQKDAASVSLIQWASASTLPTPAGATGGGGWVGGRTPGSSKPLRAQAGRRAPLAPVVGPM